jgi:hypothetical protein
MRKTGHRELIIAVVRLLTALLRVFDNWPFDGWLG